MEPIVLEALLWISLIGSAPIIWWVFYVLGQSLTRLLFSGKIIELKVVDNGSESTYRFAADDGSALVDTLLKIRSVRIHGPSPVSTSRSTIDDGESLDTMFSVVRRVVSILLVLSRHTSQKKSKKNNKEGV